MKYEGSFVDRLGRVVTVTIVVGGSTSAVRQIGSDADGLWFAADPVSIDAETQDMFDVLLRRSATIRLQVSRLESALFCASCRDAVVNVSRAGQLLFAGYVSPQTYSQPYNEVADDVELNCIDALSSLQYFKYADVGSLGHSYASALANADSVTLASVLADILTEAATGLNLSDQSATPAIWFDGSKAIDADAAHAYTLFNNMAVSELLFLGESEDDVWTQQAVVEAVLRLADLHILQQGADFYIFSWASVETGAQITFKNLAADGGTLTIQPAAVAFTGDNAADTATQVSIGDVYSRLLLTCKTRTVDDVVENPLAADALEPAYSGKQKYMTEYSANGGSTAASAVNLWECVHGETDGAAVGITDWYVLLKKHPSWTFRDSQGRDVVAKFASDGKHQERLFNNYGPTGFPLASALASIGSVEKMSDDGDNSPVSSIAMTDYMVFFVNGNGSDKEADTYPDEQILAKLYPTATYEGNVSGGTLSPADDATVNYIVLSGSLILNPRMDMSVFYARVAEAADWLDIWPLGRIETKDGPRAITRQYWKAETPRDTPEWDESQFDGFVPFTDKAPEQYEFKYSAIGDSSDTINKVGVLACMLVVGDKCVVEVANNGRPTDFEWRTFKERSECASDDEYFAQSFTIGFNPKVGDKLVGTEFPLQNNIDYTLGLDVEGTAIPVRASDHIIGRVRFMVLGPVNVLWSEITRRHPTAFRHTKWTETSVPLMAHVSSIMVKKFEVKIVSDNAFYATTDNSDLVYMSDTRQRFVNQKDDIEFPLHSDLTTDERAEAGVDAAVYLSAPANLLTRLPMVSIYDRTQSVQEKPERLYVDAYWRACSEPRVTLEQTIDDLPADVSPFALYTHPALDGRRFMPLGISHSVAAAEARLTLREIED